MGRICNNFEKNRAFYDKSMKLGTWLVDNNTKKLRVSATPKMSSKGRHLVLSKMAAFLNLLIIMSFLFASCFLPLILLKKPSVISKYLIIIFQFKKDKIEAIFQRWPPLLCRKSAVVL